MRYRMPLMACAIASLSLAACQSTTPSGGRVVENVGDPDAAVADIRDAYAATPESRHAAYTTSKGKKMRSRVMLRRQSENVLFSHPDHVDGRMTAALLAYEADDAAEAARHLDYLLRVDPTASDAALLRARIALEGGNPQLARRLLDRQVKLRPEHAGLREAQASAMYLSGDLEHAREALDEAERLGSDRGRIAYNRGLVAEDLGDVVLAARNYRVALERAPNWRLPADRLRGLGGRLPSGSMAVAMQAQLKDKPAAAKKAGQPTKRAAPNRPASETAPKEATPDRKTVWAFPPPAPRKDLRTPADEG